MKEISALLSLAIALLPVWVGSGVAGARIPGSAENLLCRAKISSNFASYKKGLRGEPDHMIYDNQRGRFVKKSQYHEYGVGFGEDLGVLAESKPAWWMAEWDKPVKANLISLSGVYPNQPEEREIEIHWPSPLPENLMEKLQEAKLKKELGVPKEQVLKELGYTETREESEK